jgi:hypothetical protein
MLRRISALAVVSVAVAALLFTARTAPSKPSPNAPVNAFRPSLQPANDVGDEVQVTPQAGSWQQRVPGPLHLRYSWLECDLEGKRCSPLPDLRAKTIVPPQELRIVTLRGVVTATNRFGSTSATTRNVYYDMAGYPVEHRRDLHPLEYGPMQLRAWYGLRPDEDGAGQTIVVTTFWRTPKLVAAVNRFSAHYGLPLVCGTASAGRSCFDLAGHDLGPLSSAVPGEDEDIEWAHAIAPKAKILVLRAGLGTELLQGLRHAVRIHGAHVFSASWAYWHQVDADFERILFRAVARACHGAHVVCTFPTGDRGAPGDRPSNSPYVLAVGGSAFRPLPDGSLAAEGYWSGGGFGVTANPQPTPPWQRDAPECRGEAVPACADRAVPDVSAAATGVLQYEIPAKGERWQAGWYHGGGTSLSSPLWAGLIALADQELARDGQGPIAIDELHRVLYRGWVSAGLDDFDGGGWSERTGLGAPKAGVVDVLTRAIERYRQEG